MRPLLFLVSGSLAIAAFFAAREVVVQRQDFSKVEIKATKAAGNVYMLEGSGGNIGVSTGPDGTLIIDDQFEELAPKIREAIKKLGDRPLRYLLNTHHHPDHTGGNTKFNDATIIAHENTRKRLASDPRRVGKVEGLPVVTFADSVSVHFNGEEIRVFYVKNAHTDNDSAIYFTKSNVLHCGDLVSLGRLPFVDLRAGGSVRGLIAGVELLIKTVPADTVVIPGHGPMATMKEVQAYLEMLKDARSIVKKGVEAGKDFKALTEEKALSKYEHLGVGFVNIPTFIELLCTDVAAEIEEAKRK